MADETPKLDVVHLEWAIEQRGKIQHTILALYKYATAQPPEGPGFPKSYLLDHLSAAAFSLWRAAFLADGSRDPFSIHESQTNFLATIINTNAINFSDDKKHQAWAVSFYLQNAKNRLDYCSAIADEYAQANTRKTITPLLRLDGKSLAEKGKGSRAATRYEWECTHRALRILFKVLEADSTLVIDELTLPSGE
jgi:hypothetical protein